VKAASARAAPRTSPAALAAVALPGRALLVAALAGAYVATYPLLFQLLGTDVAAIFVLAVLPAALLYGRRGGAVAAAVAVPLNYALLDRLGPAALTALHADWAGAVTGVAAAVAAGWARDLLCRVRLQADALERDRVRLRAEIARAEESERDLARTNAELERARAAALGAADAKSALLGRASHELRTPVAAILGYVELIQEELAAGTATNLRRDLGLVEHSARHLGGLLDDLLEITRLESGKVTLRLEPVPLGALVEGVCAVVAPLAERPGEALATPVVEPDAEVTTDRRRLEQVLLNLACNSAKFTERGRIAVTARATPEGGAVIAVSDTGIGMSPEQAERAFDEFYQANPGVGGGAGLGLAITRHLCALLGARIDVESAPGRGATFRVTLPPSPSELRPIERASSSPALSGNVRSPGGSQVGA
jgi:signal transduction histidine kinase